MLCLIGPKPIASVRKAEHDFKLEFPMILQ